MAEQRTFVCKVVPRGDGPWNVLISEDPYRGLETDAALGRWSPQWGGTRNRIVGSRRTEWGARRLARRALRTAERQAAKREREHERRQANNARQSFTLTNRDDRG